MAYSAGFTPHPKISYVGAAPTGVASEAEYLELGLAEARDPDEVRQTLDAALPPGLDVVEVVQAAGKGLADHVEASRWRGEASRGAARGRPAAGGRFPGPERAPVARGGEGGGPA